MSERQSLHSSLRSRLYAISNGQLDDRSLTPDEAGTCLAALATIAGLVWVAGRNGLERDPYVIQAQTILDAAGWSEVVGRDL